MSFQISKPLLFIPPPPQILSDPLITIASNSTGITRETATASWPFSAFTTRTWSFNLPDTIQTSQYLEYVFSIQINCSFCEFQLGNVNPITSDIQSVSNYQFGTNLVYDSSWNPDVLPPGGSIGSPRPALIPIINKTSSNNPGANSLADVNNPPPNATTVFKVWFEPTTRLLNIQAVMQSTYYIAGLFTISFGDIYPAVAQDFRGYQMKVLTS